MTSRLLLLLAASALLLPGEARAQLTSAYRYNQTVVGPGGGLSVRQGSGRGVVGPFGASFAASRSGTFVTPGGATVQYAQRSGSVVGPLGGGWAGSSSYVRVESADRGFTYTRLSSRGGPVGPFGGVAVGPVGGVAVSRTTTTAVVGPFGGFGSRRTRGIVWP